MARAAKGAEQAAGAEAENGAAAPAADADPGLLALGSYVSKGLLQMVWSQLKDGKDPRVRFEVGSVHADN